MKSLSKSAEKTFRKLIAEMALHDSRIIDNTNKTFMPVHVEVIAQHHLSLVVSVAHYFEQCGDLCQDPEMTFLVNDSGVYPMTFQQALPPVYQRGVLIVGEEIKFAPKLQRDLTTFANQWLKNIESQQF